MNCDKSGRKEPVVFDKSLPPGRAVFDDTTRLFVIHPDIIRTQPMSIDKRPTNRGGMVFDNQVCDDIPDFENTLYYKLLRCCVFLACVNHPGQHYE